MNQVLDKVLSKSVNLCINKKHLEKKTNGDTAIGLAAHLSVLFLERFTSGTTRPHSLSLKAVLSSDYEMILSKTESESDPAEIGGRFFTPWKGV